MSTVKTNNVQIGQSATATNNFTWYQPASPDGTVRLGQGHAGATSSDVMQVDSSGLLGVGGPLISVARSGTQSITSAVETVVQFNSEIYDTANCYNTGTYRFTPNVAGIYKVSAIVNMITTSNNVSSALCSLRKNGSIYRRGTQLNIAATANVSVFSPTVDTLVPMNGTTDYIDITVYAVGSTLTIDPSTQLTYMDAYLVRRL